MLPTSKSARFAPYAAIVLVLLALFVILAHQPAIRVGDGSEYYGFYYAWEITHRPWMSAPAYAAYDELVRSGTIHSMVPTEMLANWFKALQVGATSDFNHFWFYSLLAFLCGKIAGVVGLDLGAHRSFLALHWVLASVTLALAYRHHGRRGLLAAALMLLASPMFWFLNKVHTEFFTVCLVLSAVILITVKRYLPASVFLAFAATQNPSFALVALIPLLYRVLFQREQRYSVFEVAMVVAVVLAVLAHPVYYFARYGVVTPQLLAGGAALGRNIWTFYIWIIDPDLGLLPNWPLGLLVLLAGAVLWFRQRGQAGRVPDWKWIAFLLAYLAINFFAHSSTTNLNSGATPGLARYALWYLPLAYPLFLRVFEAFPVRTRRFHAGVAVLVLVSLATIAVNNPRRNERYDSPSLLSRLVQTKAPFLYNPPAEVFLERYSGISEAVHHKNLRAMLGPDCRKAIVLPGVERRGALAPVQCRMDPAKLNAFADSPAFKALAGDDREEPYYVELSQAQSESLLWTVGEGVHRFDPSGTGLTFLDGGWSQPEAWGVWSDGTEARLLLPCNERQYFGRDRSFRLALALRPFGSQDVSIAGAAGTLWKGRIAGAEQLVEFDVPAENCRAGEYKISLHLPGAVSPLKMGMSGDPRQLGVGLASLEIKDAPKAP